MYEMLGAKNQNAAAGFRPNAQAEGEFKVLDGSCY
jgi:hypothetical protein